MTPLVLKVRKTINKTPSLKKNFTWTFSGNFIYALSQWLILIILAKLGKPETVGKFSLGLAIVTPVMTFANLNLRSIQITDTRHEFKFHEYLNLRIFSVIIGFGLISGICIFSNYSLYTKIIISLIGITKAIETIGEIIYGYFQYNERMDIISKSLIGKAILSVTFLGFLFFLTNDLVNGIIGLFSAWTIMLIFFDIPQLLILNSNKITLKNYFFYFSAYNLSLKKDRGLKLFWMALPLGISIMLISLNVNIPRYFIEYNLGEYELGIFSSISYMVIAGNMVINSLGQAASPRLARYFAFNQITEFKKLLIQLIFIAFFLGILGVLIAFFFGKEILTLIYTKEYSVYSNLFVIIMFSSCIMYVAAILGYGMTAARYFKIQTPLFLVIVFITTILCMLLVPQYGLYGAIIAILISSFIQMFGSLSINIFILKKS